MSRLSGPPDRHLLFYCYSHRDQELRDQLEAHLALLKRQGVVESWYDRRISPGDDWKNAIDNHLANADVVLLLVSADFLASDYCVDTEMTSALAMADRGKVIVIPIILRPVDWSGAPFAHLQALPSNGQAVTAWPDRDAAFTDVVQGIRRAISAHIAAAAEATPATVGVSAIPRLELKRRNHPIALPDRLEWGLVDAFTRALAFSVSDAVTPIGANPADIAFEVEMTEVPLAGFDQPLVLRAVWDPAETAAEVGARAAATRRVPISILLCLTEEHYQALSTSRGAGRFYVMPPAAIRTLSTSDSPKATLRQLILQHYGRRRLSPYGIAHPVSAGMFFGRSLELGRFMDDQETSFAIVGPSRIGKSSVLQQYRWLSVQQGWPSSRMFPIDLYAAGRDPDDVFAYIASRIADNSFSRRVRTERDLLAFLRHQAHRCGGRLDLLLDEVDSICESTVLETLGHAAREGVVRLILCGRAKLAHSHESGEQREPARIRHSPRTD